MTLQDRIKSYIRYPACMSHGSSEVSVPADRSVQKPLQSAEPGSVSTAASKSANTSPAIPAASSAAVDPSCIPDTQLQPVPALDSASDAALQAASPKAAMPGKHHNVGPESTWAPDAALQAASPTAAMPGRHHNVGPESTWAVRQSAELEDLQAALNKQCFRRAQPTPEAAVASSSESVGASRELDDDAEPR